ncbi:Na+/H+ antiporter NhaA [Micromonospora lupini]|uniref:Na(+)/H(+) antiporter NhaA n=1 Tax=Micromonospora lupini str. Lupac 08 TaxID=1150864 RepID=I0L6G2_9ACTN|nr:Na+/H+ antiporter NhaA [Micromonospora lupini]CCH19409.1 Na+/H+ antiporter protein [Micromonospora lupini str. Lupac 08]
MTGSNTYRGWTSRTAWQGRVNAPLRAFLRTETGGARVVLVAAVAALVWANLNPSSYESVWSTFLSIQLGDWSLSHDLRTWVNSGLMTFFFLVAGLELRREFDIGELRERRRLALPMLAGFGGMLLPIGIYLAINAGHPTATGWGAVMATDTALALGALAVFGPRFSDRLRGFLLTVAVVDDVVAIAVLAIAYPHHPSPTALLVAAGIFALVLVVRAWGVRFGPVYALLGVAAWVAVSESGVDPVAVGLVMGLLTYAYAPGRTELQRASDQFRLFREQPTPQLARMAQAGLTSALSPNERLQTLYHPWASYVVVPLFALANAGIVIDSELLARAFTSPVTLGVVVAYVVGKPAGIVATSWLVARLSGNRFRPPVGWLAVAGVGTVSGIGFTVALLIATHALSGPALDEAKLGILVATVGASVVTWLVFRAVARLSPARRARALLGVAEGIVDLKLPVDPERDHMRGSLDAPVTVVEYGDFECPYCGQAEPVVRELLADFANVRYVWRHLPLTDVHPHAQLAAEAAEAAGEQGAFWGMHDLLLAHQDALDPPDVLGYADQLGLDLDGFREHMAKRMGVDRIAEDVDSADLSGVTGTPTFFINGRRHHGAYDIAALSAAVKAAFASAKLRPEYHSRDPERRDTGPAS